MESLRLVSKTRELNPEESKTEELELDSDSSEESATAELASSALQPLTPEQLQAEIHEVAQKYAPEMQTVLAHIDRQTAEIKNELAKIEHKKKFEAVPITDEAKAVAAVQTRLEQQLIADLQQLPGRAMQSIARRMVNELSPSFIVAFDGKNPEGKTHSEVVTEDREQQLLALVADVFTCMGREDDKDSPEGVKLYTALIDAEQKQNPQAIVDSAAA